MKYLQIIKKIFAKDSVKPLGRWNIEYCTEKLNRKIDLSNEDHCGPCGQYKTGKKPKENIHFKNINIPI